MTDQPATPVLPELRVVTGHTTPDRACQEVIRSGTGDGLPLGRPTVERVEAMLGGRSPGQAITPLPPLFLPATVEDAAVAAVLAGCAPPAFRYLLAALSGVVAPEFNLLGVSTTTGNAAVGMLVHGPGTETLGSSAGANCLGPVPVNSTLGRALALGCRLLGGAVPGSTDMATIGQPGKLSFCTAEGTESQGWESMHVSRGCASGSDAVTVFAASGILEVADTESDSASGLLETLAAAAVLPAAMHSAGHLLGGGQQLFLLPPEWMDRLGAEGWSRTSVGEFLYEHAVLPVDMLPSSGRARMTDDVRAAGLVRIAESPAAFLLLAAGGVGVKAAYVPSWPGGSTAVTRLVA